MLLGFILHADSFLDKMLYSMLLAKQYLFCDNKFYPGCEMFFCADTTDANKKSSRIMPNICDAKRPLFFKIPMFQTSRALPVVRQHVH